MNRFILTNKHPSACSRAEGASRLLQLRSRESDPSSRVQLALDLMHIAACERIRRLLRSDLPDDQG